MAILRFPSATEFKTTVDTIVVGATSQFLSTGSRSDNDSADTATATDSSTTRTNRWMQYEIPDNESQAATRSMSLSCWDTASVWSINSDEVDSLFPNWNSILQDSSSSSICTCHSSLLYRTLYYCKMIVYKVGRSYYALPMLLLLFTLLIGVGIGYVIGTRYANNSTTLSNHNRMNWKVTESPITPTQQNRWMVPITIFFGSITQSCATMKRYIYVFFQRLLIISSVSVYQLNKHNNANATSSVQNCDPNNVSDKEREARIQLKSDDETKCESGLQCHELPYHIAVVMDGNRRYGKQQYNNPMLGHWDGSKKLLQFVKWCLAEHIKELTVYALSTENWSRDTNEITSLMNIIVKYCEELRIEAIEKKISIHILSTDPNSIPLHVQKVLHRLEHETHLDHPALRMNICLSYGSRGEMVNACRSIVTDYIQQYTSNDTTKSKKCFSEINEDMITKKLLLCHRPPDICIRTSGEVRLSNFLLWQMAYTELFFIERHWPEIQKDDLLRILRSYAYGRQRRFGR